MKKLNSLLMKMVRIITVISLISALRAELFLKLLAFSILSVYRKTCVKWPLKNRQNNNLYDKW